MIQNRTNQVAAIFIDASYLIKTLKHQFDAMFVDYQKLARELALQGETMRIYYYSAYPYMSPEPTPYELMRRDSAERLFRALRRIPGLEIRLGRVERRMVPGSSEPQYHEKRVDVRLALDLALLAANREITRAILLAGDSDFVPAVEEARDQGVTVELLHGGRAHPDLQAACDRSRAFDWGFLERVERRRAG